MIVDLMLSVFIIVILEHLLIAEISVCMENFILIIGDE